MTHCSKLQLPEDYSSFTWTAVHFMPLQSITYAQGPVVHWHHFKHVKHISIIESWTILALFCRAVVASWLKPIRKWGRLTMTRMEMDCNKNFRKSFRMLGFQRLQFGLKIIEILQKCWCRVDLHREIEFNHIVRANEILIKSIIISGPFPEFTIYSDSVP